MPKFWQKHTQIIHHHITICTNRFFRLSAGTSMYLVESVLLRFSDWMFTVVAKLALDPS